MAVRTTMLALVHFVRGKIGDPDNGAPQFSTQDIQDELDATAHDVFDEPLLPMFERTASGILYRYHFSKHGFFEDGETILLPNLTPITPDSRQALRPDARYFFTLSEFPPIWIQYGVSYDPYRVAANLLEQWVLAQASLNVDFNAAGSSFRLSQITDTRLKLVASYRMKQRVEMIAATRHDIYSAAELKRKAKVGEDLMDIPFVTGE